jgi:hypothetical protein
MPPLPEIDSIQTLGGVLRNSYPVADPTTDLDADRDNVNRCDTAMMTRMGERCWCAITLAATTGALVVVAKEAQWGLNTPAAPTPVRTATGSFTITWPTSVLDELGNAHALALRWATGHARGSARYSVQASTVGNVITFYVFDSSGALSDAAGVTIDVKAG